LISSDIHITRNISCPVSPIGSPLLNPRSPQHLNGRLSPSPISSPITMSGSSTPLSGGTGAIPFHHLNQLVYLQEAAPLPQSPYMNSPSYWDPDVLRGPPSGSHAFRELFNEKFKVSNTHENFSYTVKTILRNQPEDTNRNDMSRWLIK